MSSFRVAQLSRPTSAAAAGAVAAPSVGREKRLSSRVGVSLRRLYGMSYDARRGLLARSVVSTQSLPNCGERPT